MRGKVHFGQNSTVSCSKYYCFHKMPTSLFFFSNNNSLIFFNKITIILFSSSLSLFLLFFILLLLKKKNKRKSKKCDVSYECIFVQSCLALRPLSPVHCTSSIEHCALNTDRCVLCRVASHIARRPPVLVLRALVRVHRAPHRGQSSSYDKRKNGTTMGTVLRIVVRLSFICCCFGFEFSEFCA